MLHLLPRAARVQCVAFVVAGLCGCSANEQVNPVGTAASTTTGAGAGGAGGVGGGGGAGGEEPTYPAPYSLQAFDAVRITSDGSQPNFQQAVADIDLRDAPFAQVTLSVDLESTCYPFEKWQDNPPPAGENWPADCDAFDRNFELSIDDPRAPDGPPGIELVRAITPFGGPLHLDVDITDVANGLPGAHRLKVVIPTWSDGAGQVSGSNGGWNVSARIDAVPGKAPRSVLAVTSLFNGGQSSLPGPGPVAFQVPEGATGARLEYRVTGHGGGAGGPGCIGPAEEFCKRDHIIQVDGALVEEITPWRTDCEQLCTITHYGPENAGFDYCLENPCGSIQSVQASRANWCPGSVTPPFVWDAAAPTTAGEHTFSWDISTLTEGGSWRISATYFAFGP